MKKLYILYYLYNIYSTYKIAVSYRPFYHIQKAMIYGFMVTGYKRIKILSEAEVNDLYSLPKFTLEERIVFFSLNKKERQLIEKIPDISSKVHAIL
ncbi:hypothetical protein [Candidatus Tisiphia endosymbiont of Ditula angustiorana]